MKSTTLPIFLAVGFLLSLRPGLPAAEPGTVSIQVADDHVDFLVGKDLVTSYRMGPKVAKPYFWPVNGPNGSSVTRGWPMTPPAVGGTLDHPHQKSLWFCHGDVIAEGIDPKAKLKGVTGVDFWSELPGHGVIACTRVDKPQVEGNHGQVATHNEWRTAAGQKILDETRTLHLYDLGTSRLLVVDVDLHASVCPITFGDTKEGSFGVRVNDLIREAKKGGKIENAEGKTGERGCWGLKSDWCDYSGSIDGKVMGIAVFDDPANPARACWHVRGYGLMAANPFGRSHSAFPGVRDSKELVKLPKDGHIKFRYGVLIHPGDAKEGKVAEAFQEFVKLRK